MWHSCPVHVLYSEFYVAVENLHRSLVLGISQKIFLLIEITTLPKEHITENETSMCEIEANIRERVVDYVWERLKVIFRG